MPDLVLQVSQHLGTAPDGRLCYIAFLGGSKAEVDFLPMMVKRITISGSTFCLNDPPYAEGPAFCDSDVGAREATQGQT